MPAKEKENPPEKESSYFDSCKVCRWHGKQLQKHLKNNEECRKEYDMEEVNKFFNDRAERKRKLTNSRFYQANKKERALHYQEHKEERAVHYREHTEEHALYYQEHKVERAAYYIKHREEKLVYQKDYDRNHRKYSMAKKKLNLLANPKRKKRLKKVGRSIFEVSYLVGEKYLGNLLPDFVLDCEVHLYLHGQGICSKDTIRQAKHRVEQTQGICMYCNTKLFSVVGSNKLYCLNKYCQKAFCRVCSENVDANPFKNFTHFYLKTGLVPGLCPLFMKYSSKLVQNLRILPWTGNKEYKKPGPTVSEIDLKEPIIECQRCKELNKVEKYKDKYFKKEKAHMELKQSYRNIWDTGPAEKVEVEGKHFYVCPLCGWDKEVSGQIEDKEITYSANVEHGCFTHVCDLEQHIIDHQLSGKHIVQVEISLQEDSKCRITAIKLSLENLVEEFVSVKYGKEFYATFLESITDITKRALARLEHQQLLALYGDKKAFVPSPEKLAEFKAIIEKNESYNRDNFLVATIITKRKTEFEKVKDTLEALDYTIKVNITDANPLSKQMKNPKHSKLIYENDNVCFIPINIKTKKDKYIVEQNQIEEELTMEIEENVDMEDKEAVEMKNENDMLLCPRHVHKCERLFPCSNSRQKTDKQMRLELIRYFWPKIKKILKECSCETTSECISGIVGWDCVHDTKCSCLKSNCLSRERALAILTEYDSESDQSDHNSSSTTSSSTPSSDSSSSSDSDGGRDNEEFSF